MQIEIIWWGSKITQYKTQTRNLTTWSKNFDSAKKSRSKLSKRRIKIETHTSWTTTLLLSSICIWRSDSPICFVHIIFRWCLWCPLTSTSKCLPMLWTILSMKITIFNFAFFMAVICCKRRTTVAPIKYFASCWLQLANLKLNTWKPKHLNMSVIWI